MHVRALPLPYRAPATRRSPPLPSPTSRQAALEFMLRTGRQPDILHCHDWSTADVAKAYWTEYHHYGLWKPKVVSGACTAGQGGWAGAASTGVGGRTAAPA